MMIDDSSKNRLDEYIKHEWNAIQYEATKIIMSVFERMHRCLKCEMKIKKCWAMIFPPKKN